MIMFRRTYSFHKFILSRSSRLLLLGIVIGILCYILLQQPFTPSSRSCIEQNQTKVHKHRTDCYFKKYCIRYLMKPNFTCKETGGTKLLSFVISKMSNFQKRHQIRKTWGNGTVFNIYDLRVVFILSKERKYADLETQLHKEAELYNDLILVDFIESYDNLTLKTITGLHWTNHFCPEAFYILKTDDDVFINTFSLLEVLTDIGFQKNAKEVLMGKLIPHAPVERSGKYRMNMEQFGCQYYPKYLSGPAYIMSQDVVKKLNEQALIDTSLEVFRIEDVYVTGILAERAKILPFQVKEKLYNLDCVNIPEWYWKDYLVWHHTLKPKQALELWKALVRLSRTTTRSMIGDVLTWLLQPIFRHSKSMCWKQNELAKQE